MMLKGDSQLASSHLEIYVSLMKFFETTVAGWNKDTYISRYMYEMIPLL